MQSGNPGAEWVDRYLVPRIFESTLSTRFRLRCLQFGPDDDEESQRLRELGHLCHVVIPQLSNYSKWRWHQSPVLTDWKQIALRRESFDLIFTPWFGRMAGSAEAHGEAADVLQELLKPGGAILLSISNGRCPLDLIARKIYVPGSARPTDASLAELRKAFSSFDVDIRLLSVRGHFRWGRLPGWLAFVGPWIDRYLEWASDPAAPGRYGSMLNPVLMLWIEKKDAA